MACHYRQQKLNLTKQKIYLEERYLGAHSRLRNWARIRFGQELCIFLWPGSQESLRANWIPDPSALIKITPWQNLVSGCREHLVKKGEGDTDAKQQGEKKLIDSPFIFFQEADFVMRWSKEYSPNSQSWVFAYQGPSPVASDHQSCLSKSWTMKGGSYQSGKEKGKGSYHWWGRRSLWEKKKAKEVRLVSSFLYSHAWRTRVLSEDTRVGLRSYYSEKLFSYFSSRIGPASWILSRNHPQASGNQER